VILNLNLQLDLEDRRFHEYQDNEGDFVYCNEDGSESNNSLSQSRRKYVDVDDRVHRSEREDQTSGSQSSGTSVDVDDRAHMSKRECDYRWSQSQGTYVVVHDSGQVRERG
jgi:hypothetical protein